MTLPLSHAKSSLLNSGQCARSCLTLQAVAREAPLSVGFFRPESWSGLPPPPPEDLPDPGIEPVSLSSLAMAGGLFTTTPPGKPVI